MEDFEQVASGVPYQGPVVHGGKLPSLPLGGGGVSVGEVTFSLRLYGAHDVCSLIEQEQVAMVMLNLIGLLGFALSGFGPGVMCD